MVRGARARLRRPHPAHGNGPPPHAGSPYNRDAPPPGWRKRAWRRGDRLTWAVDIATGLIIDALHR
ncbi:hypothetical protein [Stenotrophomonas forensis]